MKVKVTTLDNKAAGEVELKDDIFGLEVRTDLLYRAVQYQRNKAQAGTHKTKERSEVKATTKKMYKQKGTGGARHGAKSAPQFRGGGTVFGPRVRSHATGLQKKVRKLALKHALSAKQKEGTLIILADTKLKDAKTKAIATQLSKLGWSKPLIIDGNEADKGFAIAVRNLKNVDVLPSIGANVYDILNHNELVLTTAAVKELEARLS
jgi:large subunit ribosomal protein L4